MLSAGSLPLLLTLNHFAFFLVAAPSALHPARGTFSHCDFSSLRGGREQAVPGNKAVAGRAARRISVIEFPRNGASRGRGGLERRCVGRALILLGIQKGPVGANQQQLHAELKILARKVALFRPIVGEGKGYHNAAAG